MKVIYADNWKERMEKCEEINRKNARCYMLLKFVLLLITYTLTFIPAMNVVNLAMRIILIFVGLLVIWFWNETCSFIADVLDAAIIVRGGKYPRFKQVADTGATLSYLIEEEKAVVKYENNQVTVEYEKQKKNKVEKSVLHLENLEVEESHSEKEPVLDLQRMKLVKPLVKN